MYEKAGVREYWIVSPADKNVSQFILQPDGKYDSGRDCGKGKVPIHIFDGLTVDLKDVF
jgi:Uma2 family endonuclease